MPNALEMAIERRKSGDRPQPVRPDQAEQKNALQKAIALRRGEAVPPAPVAAQPAPPVEPQRRPQAPPIEYAKTPEDRLQQFDIPGQAPEAPKVLDPDTPIEGARVEPPGVEGIRNALRPNREVPAGTGYQFATTPRERFSMSPLGVERIPVAQGEEQAPPPKTKQEEAIAKYAELSAAARQESDTGNPDRARRLWDVVWGEGEKLRAEGVDTDAIDAAYGKESPLVSEWKKKGPIGAEEWAKRFQIIPEQLPVVGHIAKIRNAQELGRDFRIVSNDALLSGERPERFPGEKEQLISLYGRKAPDPAEVKQARKNVEEYLERQYELSVRGTTMQADIMAGTSNLIPYGVEFALTGGAYALGSKAARHGLLRMLGSAGKRKLVQEAVRVGGWAAGTTARVVSPVGALAVASGAQELLKPQLTGDFKQGEDGEVDVLSGMAESDRTELGALAEAFGRQWAEVGGEQAGEGLVRLGTHLKGHKAIKLLLGLASRPGGKTQVGKILKAVGKQNLQGEIAEEQFTRTINNVLFGDPAIPTAREFATELGVLGVPSLVGLGGRAVGAATGAAGAVPPQMPQQAAAERVGQAQPEAQPEAPAEPAPAQKPQAALPAPAKAKALPAPKGNWRKLYAAATPDRQADIIRAVADMRKPGAIDNESLSDIVDLASEGVPDWTKVLGDIKTNPNASPDTRRRATQKLVKHGFPLSVSALEEYRGEPWADAELAIIEEPIDAKPAPEAAPKAEAPAEPPATPKARELASASNIPLSDIPHKGAKITVADVRRATKEAKNEKDTDGDSKVPPSAERPGAAGAVGVRGVTAKPPTKSQQASVSRLRTAIAGVVRLSEQPETRARRKYIDKDIDTIRTHARRLGIDVPARTTYYNPEADIKLARAVEEALNAKYPSVEAAPAKPSPTKPSPQAEKPAKQPWEMTLDEWRPQEAFQPISTAEPGRAPTFDVSLNTRLAQDEMGAIKGVSLYDNSAGQLVAEFDRTWTVDDARAALDEIQSRVEGRDWEPHRDAVRSAVSEGKPVPAAVLRDYAGESWADAAPAKLAPKEAETKGEADKPAPTQEGEAAPAKEGGKTLRQQLAEDESGSLPTKGMEEVFGAAGKALVDTAKEFSGLTRAWRAVITLPGRIVANIPDGNPLATIRDWMGAGLSSAYGKPRAWVERMQRIKGSSRAARIVADRLARQFSRAMSDAGFDIGDPATHMLVENAVRGRVDVETLPPPLRAWVEQARALLDAETRFAVDVFRSVGMEDTAKTYEGNIGEYLKNIPLAEVSPSKRAKHFIGKLLGPRLSKSFGKMKRDKWAVRVNGRTTKYETETEAREAYKLAVEAKKDELINKRGKAKEWTLTREGRVPRKNAEGGYDLIPWEKTEEGVGMEPADLYRQAARQVTLIDPIPEAWRVENEIHNPAYLVWRSIMETRHNAEIIKMFSWAAKKYGVEAPKGTQAEIDAWAKENKLAKLPNSRGLHALKNTFVPKGIADDLTDMERLPSIAAQAYRMYLTAWKSSKTLYNPATHARNIMGNPFFAYLGRASIWNPANLKHYYDALRELVSKEKGADYEYLVEKGVVGSEYYGAELKRVEQSILGVGDLSRLDQALASISSVHGAVGNVYAAEDQVFKLAAYKIYRARGMTKSRAAREVNKWFPNYDNIGKLTRWARTSPMGAPFLSFLDQSLRIAGRAAKDRPIRLASIVAVPAIMSYMSAMMLGMGPDEKELLDQDRDYWEPLLPFRDDKGRALTLDLRYIVPLANDIIPESRGEGFTIPWAFNGPLLQAGIEQLYGLDSFTRRPIAPTAKDATGREKVTARLKTAAETIIPHPSILTYGYQRVKKAESGEGEEPLARALLGVVGGINARKPYVSEDSLKSLVLTVIEDGDAAMAERLVKLWNESYKPAYKKRLSVQGIRKGGISSERALFNRYRDDAAEEIIRGNMRKAQEIVETFRRKHPESNRKLTMSEAASRAERLKQER